MKSTQILFWIILVVVGGLFYNYYDIGLPEPVEPRAIEVVDVVRDTGNISVVFCPSQDCEGELVKFMGSAKKSLHCAFFDLDLADVKNVLSVKDKEGVDVKLVVDTDNYDLVSDLNIPIKQDERSSYMHNKFCIVDGSRVSTGSMNPTDNGAVKNNNNLLFVNSKEIALRYEDEFSEFWEGTFGQGDFTVNNVIYVGDVKTEVYFCPEDCRDEAVERIADLIKGANESVKFMTFSFTHDTIGNALLVRKDEVDIAGIFESTGAGSQYSKYNVLEYQGFNVTKDKNKGVMHHKVFIIDDKIVVTGSFNPSNNAQTRNDENIIIIYDEGLAKKYLEEFDRVWNWND